MSSGCSSRHRADQSGSSRSAPRRSSSVASAPSSTANGRSPRSDSSGSDIETSGSTQKAAPRQVVSQPRILAFVETDAHALTYGAGLRSIAADPELAGVKEIDAVLAPVDVERRRQPSGSARQILEFHVRAPVS